MKITYVALAGGPDTVVTISLIWLRVTFSHRRSRKLLYSLKQNLLLVGPLIITKALSIDNVSGTLYD